MINRVSSLRQHPLLVKGRVHPPASRRFWLAVEARYHARHLLAALGALIVSWRRP